VHPFPATADLPTFESTVIYTICFGPYQVDFVIGPESYSVPEYIAIGVQHRLEHREADGTVWFYDCQAASRSPTVLYRLFGKTIISMSREDAKLCLGFDDGSSLTIFTEIDGYESGSITWNGQQTYF
jgi:hypothetical protein